MDRNKAIRIIFCFLLPFFLLLLSYLIILTFIPTTPAQQETINYLTGKNELYLDYGSAELSHLRDVQRIMRITNFMFWGLLGALFFIVTYHWNNKNELPRCLKYGGITTIVSIGIITLFLGIAFNSSFVIFHQLFFPQGNWQFAADSLLIQTFPIGFFIKISFFIFGMALAGGLLIFLVSVVMRRYMYSATEILK